MNTAQIHENTDSVRAFFDQWQIYRKIVAADCLCHREETAALARWLDAQGPVGRFADLACGDASFTAPLLASRHPASYTGIDVSDVALSLARKNTAALSCPKTFVCGDFLSELEKDTNAFDTIYVGLSVHHLVKADKCRFFAAAARALGPGGRLAIYEPAMRPGESFDQFLGRSDRYCRQACTTLDAGELESLLNHIKTCDLPETSDDYGAMGRRAGFRSASILFRDPQELWVLMGFDL